MMERVGFHKRTFEYDGMFECLDCNARWGALPGNPTMPLECKMTELESTRERLIEIKNHALEHYHRRSFCPLDVEDCLWLCDQLEGFLSGETVKRLEEEVNSQSKDLDVRLEKALENSLAVQGAIAAERERCAKIADFSATKNRSYDPAGDCRAVAQTIATAIRRPSEEVPNG